MGMLKISLPDGLLHEYASGITVGEIVRNAYGKKSGAVAALVNGEEGFLIRIGAGLRY